MRKTVAVLTTAALLVAAGPPAQAATAGSLDKTFSGDGKAQEAFGGGFDTVTSRDVLLTSSGKVVVVSELAKPGAVYWGIARMRNDGSPDPSFRGNGRRTTAFEHDDVPHRVVSQGQGRILVGGSGGGAFALASYDKDGSPNSTFGLGKVTTDVTAADDVVLDLRVLSDGKVLAAGLAGDQFAVVRYLPSGDPDDTFGGGDGIVLTTEGFAGTAYDVVLQPDGKLIAVGETEPDEGIVGVAVSRFDTDGSLDETFGGGDGRVETFPSSREFSRGYDVLVQPDGKIVVGGYAFGEGDYSRFLLARYLPGGALDGSFGSDGVVVHLFQPYYAEVHAVALQADGKLVAAGWSDGETPGQVLAVARYGRGGTLDKSFSGNGQKYVSYGVQKRAQALGLAVRGGRIVAVGEVANSNETRSKGTVVAFIQ